jgi:hypothetical protein
LKSFGIPGEHVPFSSGLMAKEEMKTHLHWVQLQQSKEELLYGGTKDPTVACFDIESVLVECPQNEDCLFGKGRAIMKHPGTLAMHNMLKCNMDRWNAASFKEKNGITWEVVHEILNSGGRYLQQDPCHGWFVPVEDDVARQKVSIAFRDMAKRIRKRSQRWATKQPQEKTLTILSEPVAQIQMLTRYQDQYLLSSKKQFCGLAVPQTCNGAMCSFLCDRSGSHGASSGKAPHTFESWGS